MSVFIRQLMLVLSLGVFSCAAQSAASDALLQISDMQRIVDVSTPVTSPDGRWIAYAVTDNSGRKAITHLWLISWDGSQQRELPIPPQANAWQPEFTRDSRELAFLSDQGSDHSTQVWMQKLADTNATQVTSMENGVLDFSLAPDGQQLAVVAQDGKPDDGIIVIERFQFKDDERGYLSNAHRRLYRVVRNGQLAVPLTPPGTDVWLPAWSPDGIHLAYVSKRLVEGERHAGYNVYIVNAAAGSGPRCISVDGKINNDPDHLSRPAWSEDGRQIAYLQGGDEHWLEYAPWELVVADLASGQIRQLGQADRNYIHPQFSSDGKSLYAIVEQSRTAFLSRIDLTSGKAINLTRGKRMDADYSVDVHGHIVLLSCADTHPCALSIVNSAQEKSLPGHNDWLAGKQLVQAEDLDVISPDGAQVHAMLIRPHDDQPGKSYPTIVRLHGGPVYQFSHEFMIDWQIYSAQGYAVLAVNPRGSSGRGFDYARAIWADWGNLDVRDVLAATDAVVAQGIADPNRLGVGGWSYGGMLTDYTIATDQRFAAAIAGAGTGNMLTNYGSDEYTVWLEAELGMPWENPAAYLKVSYPFFHNDRITTPTLFVCAALDFNVPCSGSEQMYQGLRSRRVPSQLVIYQDQHHQLDIPGNLSDRLTRYLGWYDRYVKNRTP